MKKVILYAFFLIPLFLQADYLDSSLGLSGAKTKAKAPAPSMTSSRIKRVKKNDGKALTQKDIDRIFVSFRDERERKARERVEKKRLTLIEKNMGGSSTADAKPSSSKPPLQKTFFPRTDITAIKHQVAMLGRGDAGEASQIAETFNNRGKYRAKRLPSLSAVGVSCYYGECVVFTNKNKTLKVGDLLPLTREKILDIKPHLLKTDKRTIKF